ncbi:MAG: DegV family protein [Lachnospiraceae bacterium]|nr:DegV family protein [Lachnospiraceae bacterium]
MKDYVIVTDTACDISQEILQRWGVQEIDLTFRFEKDNVERKGREMPIKEFYNCMREGGVAKTAAINPDVFIEAFEKILAEEKDILYIGFSSGLSSTFNSSQIAANELKEKYPDRKITAVDSLCASAGQGLYVYLAVQKSNSGASLEELADYLEDIKLNICHWFTVDDLVYLKRGGRVSATTAFVGTVLSIKPVMHVDNEGKLIPISKCRGRKASLSALADRYGELRDESKSGTVFISHSDALEDAEYLRDLLKSRYGTEVEIITDIGPIIGAHSGPGTMALFFVGTER